MRASRATAWVMAFLLVTAACSDDDGESGFGAEDDAGTTTTTAAAGAGAALGKTLAARAGDTAKQGESGPRSGITSTDKAVYTSNVNTMEDFLTAIIVDVDAYWAKAFAANNLPYAPPQYRWNGPGEAIDSGCHNADGSPGITNDRTAFWCTPPNNPSGSIFISSKFAYDLWTNNYDDAGRSNAQAGDFSVAYVVAHEMAHHVQGQLKIRMATREQELQADCLAGVWANSAYYKGILEPGDVEEGIATANLVGDYGFNEPGHHGTPDERSAAFQNGYNSGSGGSC